MQSTAPRCGTLVNSRPGSLIFPALGTLTWLAALVWLSEMIPGSRHRMAPASLLGFGSLVLLAIFAILFRDYRTHRLCTRVSCA
jgi:sterol desaturase/sphingolipid hydroxylase (fatty acid hydroxylase superfamily)